MAKEKRTGSLKINMDLLWEIGARIIFVTDIVLDKAEDLLKDIWEEIKEIAGDGLAGAVDVGDALIRWHDKSAEIVEWFIKRTAVHILRRYHDLLMDLSQYRRIIIRDCAIVLLVGIGAVAVFASAVDYEYAYNGRTLGIVREQRDVLEILEMVSEELSLEYGSSIVIDPETDIIFRPVISYGKVIDDADTVLRRFTYMGDIQA